VPQSQPNWIYLKGSRQRRDVVLLGIGQDAVDRGEADSDIVGDHLAQRALASEPQEFRGLRLGGGSPPSYFPSPLALAMPSRWQSSIISRSNSAILYATLHRPFALSHTGLP
jgi:hypothetical protein